MRVTEAGVPSPWVMLPLVLLLACGTPPALTNLAPDEARPGDVLTVTGEAIDAGTSVVLSNGSTERPLALDVQGPTRATVALPDDLSPGTWTVTLVGEAGRSEGAEAVTVWTPESEPPCDKRYALDVETHRTQRKVAVTRIYTDRPADRDVFFGDDLDHLEVATQARADGSTCHAVWLHTKAQGRWLIADDPDRDLGPVAAGLAEVLDVPLQGR